MLSLLLLTVLFTSRKFKINLFNLPILYLSTKISAVEQNSRQSGDGSMIEKRRERLLYFDNLSTF